MYKCPICGSKVHPVYIGHYAFHPIIIRSCFCLIVNIIGWIIICIIDIHMIPKILKYIFMHKWLLWCWIIFMIFTCIIMPIIHVHELHRQK